MHVKSDIERDVCAQTAFDFFQKFSPDQSLLILDGSGPGITSHLPPLGAIGPYRINTCREVHAFSGGIFAYLAMSALFEDQLLHPAAEYSSNLDRALHGFHHSKRFSVLKAFYSLLRRRPPFEAQSLLNHIDYVFKPQFLSKRLTALAGNFIPYLSVDGFCTAIPSGSELRQKLTVRELLMAGSAIPFVYSQIELTETLSDGVYASNFRAKYRELRNRPEPKLILTIWKRGTQGNLTFLNAIGSHNPKIRFWTDVGCLFMNVRRPKYRDETARGVRLMQSHNSTPLTMENAS